MSRIRNVCLVFCLLATPVVAQLTTESGSPRPIEIVQEGQWHLLGHYAKPWEQHTLHVRDSIVIWPEQKVIFHHMTVDSSRHYENMARFASAPRYFEQGDSLTPWKAVKLEESRQYSSFLLARFPELLLREAKKSSDVTYNADSSVCEFTFNNCPWRVTLDPKTRQAVSVSFTHPEELYGDVTETFALDTESEGWDSGVAAGFTQTALNLTMQEMRTVSVATHEGTVPASWFGEFPPAEEYSYEWELLPVADRLFEIRSPDIDSRSLIVEFEDHLMLIETLKASAFGESMSAVLHDHFPNKPVTQVAISHHHPHYTGGLRPFVHTGASVLCSSANVEYIRTCLSRARTLDPDALSNEPREPIIVGAGEHWEYSDGFNAIEAFEIGEHSHHTDSFLLFYHPPTGIAFGGDLLWVPEKPNDRPLSKRTTGLHTAISELGLEVSRFLTSWPVGGDWGYKDQVIWSELDSAAVAD